MSLPKDVWRQRDFSGGEIDASAARRDDIPLVKAGLKLATNIRPLDTGAATRRPGRRVRYYDSGRHDIIHPVSNVAFDVTFAANRFTARLVGGAIVTEIDDAPWGPTFIDDITWEVFGRRIFVCHRLMRTQVLEYDRDTGQWTLFPYEFRTGLDGQIRAPFYRFQAFGVTIQPSARTGTITVTASDPVFSPSQVGILFRYAGKQFEVTGYTSPTLVTASVIETLPPTIYVTLDNVDGFQVGEIVAGATSGTQGEVGTVNTVGKILTILITKNWGLFTDGETVVGSLGQGIVSAIGSAGPAATVQWEEAFMSDYRGWPGSVSTDSQRIIFCDFGQFEEAILWSAVNAADDCYITGEADAAILDYVPQACRVLYVVGDGDEFVFTDVGVFFIPLSGSQPLSPGSIEYRRIGADGAKKVRPVAAGDFLIWVGKSNNRLYAVTKTGAVTKPYGASSLTDFHSHLFESGPRAMAVSEGEADIPGRHVYVAMGDGSLVVGRYDEAAKWVGWFPWIGAGNVNGIAGRYGDVVVSVTYDLDSGSVDVVEAVDTDALLDGQIDLADLQASDALTDSTGAEIEDSTGAPILMVMGALLPFANATLDAIQDGFYLGRVTVNAEGGISALATRTDGPVSVGWNFTPAVSPYLPARGEGQDTGQRLRRRKIGKVVATVRDTQAFLADGHVFAGFRAGENQENARPNRDASYPWGRIGRSYDPEINLSQPVPGNFTLIELTAEVTG